MNSLSFTTLSNPEWDKKSEEGLRNECETLTGIDDFKTHTLYATINNSFAGAIHVELHGNILWIDSIWVEQHFRKQGVGIRLIQEALDFATQKKAIEVQLNTFFPDAHAFFLMCHFEDIAQIPNWKYGLDCYLMRRKV